MYKKLDKVLSIIAYLCYGAGEEYTLLMLNALGEKQQCRSILCEALHGDCFVHKTGSTSHY